MIESNAWESYMNFDGKHLTINVGF